MAKEWLLENTVRLRCKAVCVFQLNRLSLLSIPVMKSFVRQKVCRQQWHILPSQLIQLENKGTFLAAQSSVGSGVAVQAVSVL